MPVILVVLIVFAIMGIAILSSGASEYAQSALVAYGRRAGELALAGLEEAQTVAYDKLNSPTGSAAWKQDLLRRVRRASQGDDTGVIHEVDLLSGDLLPRAVRLARETGGEIEAAKVQFYGFRRLPYDSKGTFARDSVYYKDPKGIFDQGGVAAPDDFIGYYTLEVEASFGRSHRTLSATHDVKIVDVSPPARKFALFSFGSANPDDPRGPPRDFMEHDLNRGGGLKVFGNGVGRVFVRGPFYVETEGHHLGIGGHSPKVGPSYPPDTDGRIRSHWHGWSLIPAFRDGTIERAGAPLVNFGVDPMRPESLSGRRSTIIQRGLDVVSGSTLTALLSDDPGWYLVDQSDPQYYAAARAVDPKGNGFSILGDPKKDDPRSFSLFRGYLTKYDSNDAKTWEGESTILFSADRRTLGEPKDEDARWAIEPEGGLIGVYNRIGYRRFSEYLVIDRYTVSTMGKIHGNYGLRWEKSYGQGYFDRLLGDLARTGAFLLALPIAGALSPALAGLGITAFASSVYLPVLAGTAAATAGSAMVDSPRNPSVVRVNVDDVENAFPSNFKPYERAVTRRYEKLSDLGSVQDAGKTVVLDGVIWAEDLSADRGFKYRGRGVLYSAGVAGKNEAPKVFLPIVPAGPDMAGAPDHLTLVYARDEPGKSHLGEHQVEFDYAPEAGPDSASVFRGSLVSLQGARPAPGKTVMIAGNLVCGFLNKGKIPDDSRLSVNYNAPQYNPDTDVPFEDGRWHAVAVSPRVAGWYDR